MMVGGLNPRLSCPLLLDLLVKVIAKVLEYFKDNEIHEILNGKLPNVLPKLSGTVSSSRRKTSAQAPK